MRQSSSRFKSSGGARASLDARGVEWPKDGCDEEIERIRRVHRVLHESYTPSARKKSRPLAFARFIRGVDFPSCINTRTAPGRAVPIETASCTLTGVLCEHKIIEALTSLYDGGLKDLRI